MKKRASRAAYPASALCGDHEPRDTPKARCLPDQVETVREDGACVGWAIAVALLHLGVAGLSARLRAAGIGRVPWRGSDD